jgi:peptide/nickel transport system permease protein
LLTFIPSFIPSIGYTNFSDELIDNLWHISMSALGLALLLGTTIMRSMCSSLLEVFGPDYIRPACATVLSATAVILCRAVCNALIPVMTVVGIQIGR